MCARMSPPDLAPPRPPAPGRHALGWAVFFTAVFFTLTFVAWPTLPRDSASVRWPIAQGVVTRATVKPCGRGGHGLQPDVAYAYLAEGAQRTGNAETFNGSCGDATSAWTIAGRYLPGHAVQVHVDPDDPDISVIRPGTISFGERVYLESMWLLSLCAALVAWWRRARRA